MAILKKGFIVEGTHCDACEKIVKRQALKVQGVKEVTFDLATETGYATFDTDETSLDEILAKIEEVPQYKGSLLKEGHGGTKASRAYGWVLVAAGVPLAAYCLFGLVDRIAAPELSQNMGYGLLFVVGLLTGFHCVGMCGPFIVSYTARDAQAERRSYLSHLLYGTGKLASYTISGACFGLLGSLIAFTPGLRGTIGIVAGVVLILSGLKMLDVIHALRKIRIGFPKFIGKHVDNKTSSSGPMVVGLLNGLLISCGPLFAVYVLAAGTGSWLEGAKLLFIFGVGTLPVMLGFGYFLSFLSGKATRNILKFSGALVIVLGLIMINAGLALTGSGYDFKTLSSSWKFFGGGNQASGQETQGNVAVQKDGYQEIRMSVDASGWTPDTFILKKGVPVKWRIDGKVVTNCNRAIQVPRYSLRFDVKRGVQTTEFTPTEAGAVPWSCWMGMIPGTFIVKDEAEFNEISKGRRE